MAASLRVVIADDEPLARDLVRRYIERIPHTVVVAECADGDEVGAALATAAPDVLLLDIRMPGTDVFTVLQRAQTLPAVIFATAFDDYAVRAFEFNATDYLVKPFTEARFRAALHRAGSGRTGADTEAVSRLARDLGSHPERLLAPERGRLVPVAVADIGWIQAEGDYARLHCGSARTFLIHRTLHDLERRLASRQFIRIHRSAIVNIRAICEVRPAPGGRFAVRLHDGTRLVASRSRAGLLKDYML